MATKVKKSKSKPDRDEATVVNGPPVGSDKMSEPEVTPVTPGEVVPADPDELAGPAGSVPGTPTVTVSARPEPEREIRLMDPAPFRTDYGWYPVSVVTKLSAIFSPHGEKVRKERAAGAGRTRSDTPLWDGVPVTLVIRWLGNQGFKPAQIKAGMKRLTGEEPTHGTVNNEMHRGKNGHPLPELTTDQENKLIDAMSAL
jgi:hypothetical protein